MTSRKASILGLLCLLLLQSQSTANAQYVSDGGIPGGEASGTLYSAVVPLAFPRSFLFARGDFGDRPGVENNFFTFGGFMPMQFHGPDQVFFLEGSAWIAEDDSSNVAGGTFGIGNRWMIRDFSQIIGINAFAGWDQTENGNSYDGAGIGVEWLSDYLGVTANAYIPWNDERVNALGPGVIDKDSLFFTESNLAFRAFQPVEEQTIGADFEVGSAIPRAEFLSVYAGGYYFDAEEGNDFSGVSGRIQMDMTNAIVSLTISDDDRYGTTVNFGGEIRLGDGPLNFAPRSRNLDRQMFDRVRRRSRITTTTYIAETLEIALKPDDGSGGPLVPYEFLHVDNSADPGGDGSFLSRFDELSDASLMPAADIILVYSGTTGPGVADPKLDANGGLRLTDNQIVIGEGYEGFTFETAQFPGQFCPLPFGTTGDNPYITGNLNSNLIELANNNRILGLNLLPSQDGSLPINTGNAIFGRDITVTSSTDMPFIDQVNSDLDLTSGAAVSTGSGGGIRLENTSGVAVITNSGFNIDNTVASGGVVVDNTDTADLDISIINDLMTFPNIGYNGGTAGVSLTGDNSNINATIEGVNSSDSLNGLVQTALNGGDVDVAVTDSNFTNAVEDNFIATFDGGTGTATITDTSLADAGDDAIDIFADNASDFMLTLTNSSGDDATDDGIVAQIEGGSTVIISSTGSTFEGAGDPMTNIGSGLDITAIEDSTFGGSFTDGSFNDAGEDAISLNVDGTNTIGLIELTNTSGANAGVDAIRIEASGGADARVNLLNSTDFAAAGEDGLEIFNDSSSVTVFANSTPDAIVDFSNFETGSGLNSFSTGTGATTSLTFIDGASFDNAVGNTALDAIFIESNDGALTTLSGSAISGANAGVNGINLDSDGGMISVNITDAGPFTNAGQQMLGIGDGLEVENINGGQILVNLDRIDGMPVDFSGAEVDGLFSGAADAGTITQLNFNSGANFSNVGGDAMNVISLAGAVTNITGVDMIGTNAGDNAIELIATNADSVINIDFTGTNDFSDAANNGIIADNSAGGLIDVNIGDANFSNLAGGQVAGSGLTSTADGAGTMSIFTFDTGAAFNDVGLDAIELITSDGAANGVLGANLSGVGAGDNAIDITNTGTADSTTIITLTGTNDFSGATNNGILSNNTAGFVNVSIGDADFSGSVMTPLTGSGLSSTATGDTADSNFTFNTGANFDNAGVNAIMLDSMMGGTNSLTGDMLSGANAGADAIHLNADGTGSDINVMITNATDFSAAGEDGLDFTATDLANIDIAISGVSGTPADFSGAGVNGVIGNVDNSTATLDLTDTNFNGAMTGNGMIVDVNNDATFTGTIVDSTFDMAALDGINVSVNASDATLSLTDVTANNAGDNGLMLRAEDNSATAFDVNLTRVDLNDAGGDAINAIAMNDGLIDIDAVDVNGMNATDMGVQLSADASRIDFTLTASDAMTPNDFTNSGDSGLVYNGTNGSTLNINVSDANFDDDPMVASSMGFGINGSLTDSTATVNLTDSTFNNADNAGFRLRADNSTVSGTLDTVEFNDAGTDAIFIQGLNAADVDLTMTGISGLRAGDDGFDIVTTNAMTDVNIQIDDSDFSNATNNGLEFDFRTESNITFNSNTGLTVNMAGADSLNLFGDTLATADIDITNGSLMPAFDDMTDATIMGGAIGDVLIDPTSSAGAGDNGLEFNVNTGGQLNFTLGAAGGPDPDSPISTITDPVGNNGVLGTINDGTVNLTFNNSDINTEGSSTGDGVNVMGTNGSAFTLNLNNSDVAGWSNAGSNGIVLNFEDSDATLNLGGADISDAAVDAISITASTGASANQTGSTIDLNLGDGATLDDAGSNALFIDSSGMSTTVNVTSANAMGNTLSMDNAGDIAVDATASDSGSITFMVDGFSADGAGTGGISLTATGAGSNIAGSFMNGTTQDSGAVGDDDSFGIMVQSLEGATIGTAMTPGITFTNVMTGNTIDPLNPTQDNGIIFAAENDSLLNLTFNNVTASFNEFDGVVGNVNADLSMMDDSLAVVTFMNSNINNNGANGVLLNANNAMDTNPVIQTNGIVASFMNTNINGNSNNFAQPVNPMVVPNAGADVDDIGFGVVANAMDSVITLNFDMADLSDNEEGSLLGTGDTIITNFGNMTLEDAVMICADGPGAFATTTLTNVIIQNITGDQAAISMRATGGGQASGTFNNVTIQDVEAQAFAFLSDGNDGMGTNSLVTADFNGLTIMRAAQNTATGDTKTGLTPLDAVLEGSVTNGAMANIDLSTVSISDDDGTDTMVNALDMDATLGGNLDLQIDGMVVTDTTAQTGEGEIDVTVDGTSTASIDFIDTTMDAITGINVDGSDGRGVNIVAAPGGTLDIINLDGISAQNAHEEGLNLVGTVLDNGIAMTPTVINLSNSDFSGAGQGGLLDDGVNIDLTLTGDTQLNVESVTANNATNIGFDLNLTGAAGTNVELAVDTLTANMAGSDAVMISINGGLNAAVTQFDNVTGTMAGDDGLELLVDTMSTLTEFTGTTNNFNGATDDGLRIIVDSTAAATATPTDISLTDTTANDAGGMGATLILRNNSGGTSNITLDNVDATGALGGDGLFLNSVALNGVGDVLNLDISDDSDFSGASEDGVDLNIMGVAGSTANVTIDGLTANDAGQIGVDIDFTDGIQGAITQFDNVTANMAGNEGLTIDTDNLSSVTEITGTGNSFNDAGQNGAGFDGIAITLGPQTDAFDISLTDTTANNASGGGVAIDLTDAADGSSITLSNVDAVGSMGGDGLNIDATLVAGATFGVDINGGMGGVSDFSDSSGGGVDINIAGVDGTNTIDLTINGLTANNNLGGDGFNFATANGETVNINDFSGVTTVGNAGDGIEFLFQDGQDGMGGMVNVDPMVNFATITSTANNESGLVFDIQDGYTIDPLTITGLDLSGNSVTSLTDAGLIVSATGGSTADFTFTDLNIDNMGMSNTGAGVIVNVQDASDLQFTINGTSTIADTGVDGVDIEVGTMGAGANLDATLDGLAISNVGLAPTAMDENGFDLDVAGAGTTATVTLNQTSSNGNLLGDGFNFIATSGAVLNATLTEVTGNGNGQSGLDVFATGGGTDLNLTLMTPMGGTVNTFNNNGVNMVDNDGGHGLEVRLEDTVMATLQLESSTVGNAGDGIRVTTDDSMVTIDDLGIDAESIMVDNNGGNGLTIDLDTVLGVNSIDLTGLNVNNNVGDQISITLTDMDSAAGLGDAVESLILNDVIANGPGAGMGMGTGIFISLNNSDITTELGLNNIQAVNNGLDGLRLELMDGSTIPAGSAIDTIVSMTNQDASFSNNGRHGISILLDDSMAELDIINSEAGFGRTSTISNNGESGIDIVLRNTSDLDTNIGGHTIAENGDIGVNVQLFEQSTMDLAFGATGMNGQNIIDDNVYAGIGVELFGTSVLNSFTIENTAVTNTTQGTDAGQLALGYTGDGLRVITNAANSFATDTRVINPVIGGADPMAPNTEFSNNVGRGIVFEANLDSRITNPIIRNSLINDNGDSGIRFERFANSLLDDVVISGNQINDNGGLGDAGINVVLQGGAIDISTLGPLTIDFDISDNEINDGGGRGINFDLNGDVLVDADIMDNDIFNSGQEGIRVRAEDDTFFDGMWFDNFIRDSGSNATADGINITGMDRARVGNTALIIGDSEISGSSGDGIEINGSDTTGVGALPSLLVTIMDNQQQNVNDTRGIFMNDGNGINLVASSVSTVGVVADRNVINNNGQDGIAATTTANASLTLMADENLIQQNSVHGVDLNSSGFTGMNVELTDNEIVQNVQRGVSLRNISFADVLLTIAGTVDPTPNGVGATSRIEQNGEIGLFVENDAGALNTSNTIGVNVSNTSFVGNGSNVAASDDNRNGVWIRVGTSSFGFIEADFQSNYFSGNGTIDFVTQSFIATPDPATDNPYAGGGTGQISNTNVYDPLARLALNLVDNVGDTIDVTRFGAFYNNADEFKSPNALFDSESRRRNAQRTAVDFQAALTSSTTFAELAPVSPGPFEIMGTVLAGPPAPANGSFQANAGITAGLPNNDLEGLGIDIGGVRYISAYNANNRQVTFTPALGAPPAAGTTFELFARNISGVGSSTFRTAQSDVSDDGNVWGLIISDFTSSVSLNPGVSDASPLFGNPQTFTWEINDLNAPNYVFP